MNVRAYRVIETGFADPSFNVFLDQQLVNFFDVESDSGFNANLNIYGSGEFDIPVDVIQKAIESKYPSLEQYTIQRLTEALALAKRNKDGFVTYSCF